ncbi:MAG: 50S ribosomal protein L29 [Methanobacteriota archaeon]|nr:MAG: 50S ribosomal protein L29 [Euryarchaeota archaeon]
MKKKLEQLRELSIEELSAKEQELRKEIIAISDAEASKARPIRKQIARIKTIIREKRSGGA